MSCIHVFMGPSCLVCSARNPRPSVPPRVLDTATTWHTWRGNKLVPLSEPWRHVGTVMYEPGHELWFSIYSTWPHHYRPEGVPW